MPCVAESRRNYCTGGVQYMKRRKVVGVGREQKVIFGPLLSFVFGESCRCFDLARRKKIKK